MNCPICKKPTAPKFRPFCSKRCADIDLGKWLNGSYATPAEEIEPEEAGELVKFLEQKPLQ